MKILITGCRGQLGTELQRQLSEEGCAIGPLPERLRKATVIPVDVDELDITDREATINYIRRHQPDTVINCAAFTNVDGCETARDAAFKVNAIGPRNLAEAAQITGAKLLHVSTDYVFGGDPYNTPCREEQKGTPTGVYGVTKLHGETVQATDLRSGAAILLAGAMAEGETIVQQAENILRGYENPIQNMRNIGLCVH